jgi:hypothetical protein
VRSIRVLLAGLLVVAGACSRREPPPTAALVRSATIKDIMDSMVDPSGDFLFESVAEIADERGVTEKAPRTDQEWAQVRRHALVLLEAPNLLVMEGRKVARPHERSNNPQVELQPEDIQKSVDGDRPGFIRRAQKLQEGAAVIFAGRIIGFTTTRASVAGPAPTGIDLENLLGVPGDRGQAPAVPAGKK